MNTITYKDLKNWYTENEEAKQLAKEVFGNHQPSIYQTGFYSAPSWNWGYKIGLVIVENKHYEVVTQFGEVVAAREVYIPTYEEASR